MFPSLQLSQMEDDKPRVLALVDGAPYQSYWLYTSTQENNTQLGAKQRATPR
jgi:hypothetical protein